jgi:hypothetical protein
MPYNNSPRYRIDLRILILGILAALIIWALLSIRVIPRDHAVLRHGEDALAIRQSCDENGPEQVWQSRSPNQQNKFFQVCLLPDGRRGIRIIECVRGVWQEVTSFVPSGALGSGTPERVREYLSGQAVPFGGRLSDMCS